MYCCTGTADRWIAEQADRGVGGVDIFTLDGEIGGKCFCDVNDCGKVYILTCVWKSYKVVQL